MNESTFIHFTVSGKEEIIEFHSNTSSEDVKEAFRSAAEAGPHDILKLYGPKGNIINISNKLPPNTCDTTYKLEVVAAQCQGPQMGEFGEEFSALEKRILRLEQNISDFNCPPELKSIKQDIDQLIHKLENTCYLTTLNPYPTLGQSLRPFWSRTHYRRKTEDEKQQIFNKFLKINGVEMSPDIRVYLRKPTFDNWQWEDEEILLLMQQMYTDLELLSTFKIEKSILQNFLFEVYKNYNEVPFHNFKHCFCVSQMMYGIVSYLKLYERIGYLETLVLLTSCICHDLDHPGFNNIYQINAKTELALRYNDISPLENHHCSVAFRILEKTYCNIFAHLMPDDYKKVREGMIRCILATDMARHNEILNQFKEIIPVFDFENKNHINILSMILIKVSDISNEARPMDVAEPWLDCLLQEFYNQSDMEKLKGLPVTPFMDPDKITKPSSQCSFIGFVLLPLFEALGALFPELEDLIINPVRETLDYYKKLNEATKEEKIRRSISEEREERVVQSDEEVVDGSPVFNSVAHKPKYILQRSKSEVRERFVRFHNTTPNSRASIDEDRIRKAILSCLEEDGIETEVDVSERTSKFKIATEDNIEVRNRRPGDTGSISSRETRYNSISSVRFCDSPKATLQMGSIFTPDDPSPRCTKFSVAELEGATSINRVQDEKKSNSRFRSLLRFLRKQKHDKEKRSWRGNAGRIINPFIWKSKHPAPKQVEEGYDNLSMSQSLPSSPKLKPHSLGHLQADVSHRRFSGFKLNFVKFHPRSRTRDPGMKLQHSSPSLDQHCQCLEKRANLLVRSSSDGCFDSQSK